MSIFRKTLIVETLVFYNECRHCLLLQEDIMRINENIINARVVSHADRINRLEYKMYEGAMNVNIQNHQYILNLIETQWTAIENSHTNMYCNYLQRINVTASCHSNLGGATLQEVRPDRCSFAPILPKLYKRYVLDIFNQTAVKSLGLKALFSLKINLRVLLIKKRLLNNGYI